MGKSATVDMFRRLGVPVHDSDAAVHELYSGDAVDPVGKAFPGVLRDGSVDRSLLAQRVLNDPQAMKRLEAMIHPMVAAHRRSFVSQMRRSGSPLVVLDVPLLFETGADADVDVRIVVTAPVDVQKQRVLARPGMTPEKFAAILGRQMPDEEKRRRADIVIDTSRGFAAVERDVKDIVNRLSAHVEPN
ncbi:MAG: dephospho-CoA kinase [Hyphomicrobiales bacterium]|nr:dephospho-CoA kinase [Hyphomicrobiales bacterium]